MSRKTTLVTALVGLAIGNWLGSQYTIDLDTGVSARIPALVVEYAPNMYQREAKPEIQTVPVSVAKYTEDDARCLAENVFGEARNQNFQGQLAVAFVTINRARDPRFPKTICGVVHEHKAFSWTLPWLTQVAKLRGSHHEEKVTPGTRVVNERAMQQAYFVAQEALGNPTLSPVGNATFYHDKRMHKPAWAKEKKIVAVIGPHIFYSWPSKNS